MLVRLLTSSLVINDHPVFAEFVGEESSDITITKSDEFKSNHLHEPQYFLQTFKRTGTACCFQFRLSYLKIMKDTFLLPPLSAIFSSTDGQKMTSKLHTYPFFKISYWKITFYQNMSVRICTHCGLSFGSIKSKQNHSPNCRLKKSAKCSNK